MPITATRGLLHAALDGSLDHAEFRHDPVFGFEVPTHVHGVDTALLDPRGTWADPAAYDAKAAALAAMFRENFAAKFADADEAIAAAGPTG
jgi:phosphoenolpyruvate carboxykinase (ATP)